MAEEGNGSASMKVKMFAWRIHALVQGGKEMLFSGRLEAPNLESVVDTLRMVAMRDSRIQKVFIGDMETKEIVHALLPGMVRQALAEAGLKENVIQFPGDAKGPRI